MTAAEWWAARWQVLLMDRETAVNFGVLHDGPCGPECDEPRIWPFDDRWWPTCPLRALADPLVVEALQTWNAKAVSPLWRWPDSYASWLVQAVMLLEAEVGRGAGDGSRQG